MLAPGFGKQLRFIARREKFASLLWVICIAGSSILFVGMYPGLFPDKESLLIMANTMNTPAMIALMGPVYGLEAITPAMIMAQECLIWFALATAIMNIFFVNRHTRADEELGRSEIFFSLPVGRITPALATLFAAFVLNISISVIIALGMLMLNIAGSSLAGILLYSFSIGIQGLVFATLTLLVAQVFSTSRATSTCMFGVLGVFYALRMFGDLSGNALSIVSPMGLGLQISAFYKNHFWPLAILLAEAVAAGVAALCICAARDVGRGLLPPRKGRMHASRFLQSKLGFVLRLCRGTILAWGIGMFAMGAIYGSVVGQIDTFVSDNEMFKKILDVTGGYDIASNYTVLVLLIGAMLAAVPVMNLVNRIRTEEKSNRLESLLSLSVSRTKMFGCYIGIAFAQSFLSLILLALGFYTGAYGTTALSLSSLLQAVLAYLPALWVMLGLCTLLTGGMPKLLPLAWGVFAFSFVILYFGRLFDIPEWAHKLTPFGNIPQLPIQEFSTESMIALTIMTVLSILLVIIGLARYKRRDIG
ncbi:MAG: ABC transporter permease [Oscillospiraceae bacterium]